MVVLFLIALAIIIGLWWLSVQHNLASLDRLNEIGFQVDYTLQSSPQVVFDHDRKQLAFLTLNKVLIYDYDQVLDWDTGTTPRGGWSNKTEVDESHYIIFYLKDEQNPTLRVEGLDKKDIDEWRARFDGLNSGTIQP